MNNITVVKIGGKLIENKSLLNDFILKFSKLNRPKILVHGGGNIATEISKELNV